VGSKLASHLQVLGALDSLRHHPGAQVEGQGEERPDRHLPRAVARHPVDQRPVDLDEVGAQLEDVTKRCVARPGVIDGDPQSSLA